MACFFYELSFQLQNSDAVFLNFITIRSTTIDKEDYRTYVDDEKQYRKDSVLTHGDSQPFKRSDKPVGMYSFGISRKTLGTYSEWTV